MDRRADAAERNKTSSMNTHHALAPTTLEDAASYVRRQLVVGVFVCAVLFIVK